MTEKIRYVEHVLINISAGKWSGGQSNRPHWLAGDQVIWGHMEQNPESGHHEMFQLEFEWKFLSSPKVYLKRWNCSKDFNDKHYYKSSGANIPLSKHEASRLLEALPRIQRECLVREKKLQEETDQKQNAMEWWP